MTTDLPIREILLDRLCEINNSRILREDFYPFLLQEAGKEHTPESLVGLLVGAARACEGIVKGRAMRLACMYLDQFVDAMVFELNVKRQTLRLLKPEQKAMLEPWRKRG